MSAASSRPDVYYGGQAVIEGVMIRAPRHMAIAVRHPSGEIVRHTEELTGFTTGRARQIPLMRGALVLWETLSMGLRAINYSSRIALDEPEEGEEEAGNRDGAAEKDEEYTDAAMWVSMTVGIVFAVALFFVGPVLLANFLESQGIARAVVVAIEAALRLVLFVGYIALIGLMPDIRRVFQYHGAEHMTIHAYEAARPLTVGEVRGLPKEHTRCGTSFLVVVIIVALAAFLAFDLLVDEGIFVRIASRVVLLPPIAGISYEVLRLGARYESNPFVRALFTPNIALQALTTRVPEDDQIEVAIAAFETAVASAGEGSATTSGG
ncbi:MAG: DUF1385 domain-containing protein [Dehalococcoidia bacterium]|nr:DUF1385 domain-containing protein [Dehalococcoidia bacterium]MYA54404.1 DUF1385 domain-containing protein [Dehalococcoidia bacterium]